MSVAIAMCHFSLYLSRCHFNKCSISEIDHCGTIYLSIYLSITYLWLYSPLLELGRFLSFLILYTVGRTPCTGDQPVERQLPTHRITQTQSKRTHISMPRVGFEPTILAFKRAKTVHASDREATVISHCGTHFHIIHIITRFSHLRFCCKNLRVSWYITHILCMERIGRILYSPAP
jgi:hypothetical protein